MMKFDFIKKSQTTCVIFFLGKLMPFLVFLAQMSALNQERVKFMSDDFHE